MNYRPLAVLLACALALALPAAAVVVLSSASVTPQPAEPGGDLTLTADFTNTEGTFLNNSKAIVDLSYPFSLKASSEPFDEGFSICGYCNRKNTYYIGVDRRAPSGIYPLSIVTSTSERSYTRKTISVEVRGKPDLVLSGSAEAAIPGKQFLATLAVANIGTDSAKQVKVAVKSSDFIPSGSSVQTVSGIGSNASAPLQFVLIPSKSLKAGPYNIPIEITYLDSAGKQYNATQQLGVTVANEASLVIENIKLSATGGGQPAAGQPLTAIVRVGNAGTGDADGVIVTIACDVYNGKAFIGQLKKDENAPAVFEFTTDRPGTHSCAVRATYRDDYGNKTLEDSFDLRIAKQESSMGMFAVAAAAVVLYAIYRFTRKKR